MHPDRGGDKESFQRLQAAYSQIVNARKAAGGFNPDGPGGGKEGKESKGKGSKGKGKDKGKEASAGGKDAPKKADEADEDASEGQGHDGHHLSRGRVVEPHCTKTDRQTLLPRKATTAS